ncbi:MAG TPA: putative toxin-antitoxin system toxin component, PIN family [Thermoanaerobaculia bacterium]|nr:putative toxin-antitoxin system toxin component, PIN family [Thermoanaerobaculia bacterium]
MRIVLDTNVLVSALLTPHGPPGRLLDLVLAGKVRLLLDDRIADEYRAVLLRPRLGFDGADVAALLAFLAAESEWVAAATVRVKLSDPGDEPFAEVAIAGGADYLVTGNARHFPASRLPEGPRVATPTDALAAVMRGR